MFKSSIRYKQERYEGTFLYSAAKIRNNTLFCEEHRVCSSLFTFVNTLLKEKVLKYMSEVIISRRGGGGSNGKGQMLTFTYTGNSNFIVPNGVKELHVRIFSGGEAMYVNSRGNQWGGCGGSMNNAIINVKEGESISVFIGSKGYLVNNNTLVKAGSSFFGNYLSANGGEGSGGENAYVCSQMMFGGGKGIYNNNNLYSSGSSYLYGGGAGGSYSSRNGGNGGVYGGGGGAGGWINANERVFSTGLSTDSNQAGLIGTAGNGGIYGGGGGKAYLHIAGYYYDIMEERNFTFEKTQLDFNIGIGGQYGGNAGNNGTNTIGWSNVPEELQGPGLVGKGLWFNLYYLRKDGVANRTANIYLYGGGGGYGGCGGNSVNIETNITNGMKITGLGTVIDDFWDLYDGYSNMIIAGAGGGGYGGNGGDQDLIKLTSTGNDYNSAYGKYKRVNGLFNRNCSKLIGGGGGGYGGNGASASNGGGGGGYYSDAMNGAGGGYYNYCIGGEIKYMHKEGYGNGGPINRFNIASSKWFNDMNGCDGACIISFYI